MVLGRLLLTLALSISACAGRSQSSAQQDAAGGEPAAEVGGTVWGGAGMNGSGMGGTVWGGAGMNGSGMGGGGASAGESGSCGGPLPQAGHHNVTGTVRGARVDAVLLEEGLRTEFLGPGASATSEYGQILKPASNDGVISNGFEVRAPSDVVAASLSGWAGADAPEVGSYSELHCGWLRFEMAFPVPADVVCPSKLGNCGAECEPSGELGLCVPASPKIRYQAVSVCDAAPRGDWQLELTDVCPVPPSGTLIHFRTHGHLTATLINENDASDSVVVNLEF